MSPPSGRTFRKGLIDGIPIALGYFPVAFTLGIMSISLGLNWWEATLISLLNLTSAGQFAGLSIMAAGGTMIEMALSQVVINLRYSLMSITLSQRVDDSVSGIWRYIVPFSNTDEIFALSVSGEGPVNRWYWLSLSLLPILGWSSGTLVGALLGAVLWAYRHEKMLIAVEKHIAGQAKKALRAALCRTEMRRRQRINRKAVYTPVRPAKKQADERAA